MKTTLFKLFTVTMVFAAWPFGFVGGALYAGLMMGAEDFKRKVLKVE